MANLTNTNGNRAVQFALDGKRQTVRLGRVGVKAAERVKGMVESLVAAKVSNTTLDAATATWLTGCGTVLAERLARVGLVADRRRDALGGFLAAYAATRNDIKPTTAVNLATVRRLLVDFFGDDKPVRDVTTADAERWAAQLRPHYAEATIGRYVKRARQFFKAAVRWKVAGENPFSAVKAPGQHNPDRAAFVGRDATERMLAACTNDRWRMVIALSRYGGLRVPSELVRLTWADFGADRFRVDAPKTGVRWVPLFPELVSVLSAKSQRKVSVFPGLEPASNLRSNLLKIIKRAGLTPWPRLFHNMRASRQTELAADYPLHVVCAWLGNSPAVAARHYLQVRDSDFARAADATLMHFPAQQPAATSRTANSGVRLYSENDGGCESVRERASSNNDPDGNGILAGSPRPGKPNDGAAGRSDALCGGDPRLTEILALWPGLTPAARGTVLACVRSLAGRAVA